jgi:alpha-tubulin suppressor-like RCC1 family protein
MKNIFTLLLSFLLFFLTVWGANAQVLTGTFAAGATHSLAIHDDGTLWATGDNARGQLGTGSTASQPAWVKVGSATNWVRVAAGAQHSLALQANGTLWAWGDNTAGQLGIGTNSGTGFVATPTQVPGIYTQLAAGNAHSLALQANGTLWAWGDNFYGQLGNTANNATHAPNPTPVQVGNVIYTQLAAGYDFDLALRQDGTLWAWGRNTYGQLGNSTHTGTDDATPTPTQVGGAVYTQLAAGQYHSLALQADGSLYAWGNNFYGQLGTATGTGANTANPTPTQVPGTYTRLAAGLGHSLALQATGSLYAWGDNAAGQLGTGSGAPSATPTQVPGTYVQLAAGASHALALQANGGLWAWGSNTSGQLGSGSTSPAATPAATGTALPTRSTAMGSSFGLAVRADGTLWAWGDNTGGQLGIGTTTSRTRPVQVGTDNDWVQVAAGTSFSLALKANGTVWAWGLNNYGQLGNTSNLGSISVGNTTPTQVGTGTYVRIAAGAFHSLALTADGSLWTWGSNYYGQLGNGTNSASASATSPNPTQISGSYLQLAAGIYHSIALRANGSLYTWGSNDQGQLGVSQNFGSGLINSPTLVAGTYTALAAGSFHTLALAANGTLSTWGSNSDGQLGNIPRGTPNTATAGTVTGSYTQVAAGATHSLALRADGTLWAWGNNSSGQLGRGNTAAINSTIPTQEATGATSWTTLANSSAGNFSLVRTPSGLTFASAGSNSNGQLGDGTSPNSVPSVPFATRFDRIIQLTATPLPLPVQLVSFQARRTGATTVALSWVTATELANAGFGIERSVDGTTFSRIGFVAGAGSSSTSLSYSFPDNTALSAAYYRLAQTDIGGIVTFSPVRFVGAESDAVSRLQLVPNPASGPVQALGLPTGATLTLYDALGRLVRPAAASLDVAGLAAGVYVVRAQTPGQPVQSARLLVQ